MRRTTHASQPGPSSAAHRQKRHRGRHLDRVPGRSARRTLKTSSHPQPSSPGGRPTGHLEDHPLLVLKLHKKTADEHQPYESNMWQRDERKSRERLSVAQGQKQWQRFQKRIGRFSAKTHVRSGRIFQKSQYDIILFKISTS